MSVTQETARVWRYNGRRYFGKRSALMAEARDILRTESGHLRVSEDDAAIGAQCGCDYCDADSQWMLAMIFDALRIDARAGAEGEG